MGLCRFDVIKYRDETVQNRPKADANADLPDFLLGCIMLIFRITHHHFGDDGFRVTSNCWPTKLPQLLAKWQ